MRRRPSRKMVRSIAALSILAPTIGAVIAIAIGVRHGVRGVDIALLLSLYCFSMLGITMGYHRLFAHRSFRAAKPARIVLGILGSIAAQGPVYFWSAIHRRHHQRSDQPGDPHSPTLAGDGELTPNGLWHAHVGWMFVHQSLRYQRSIPDLLEDGELRVIDRLYPFWIALGLAIPAAIGGLADRTWAGAGLGLLWGGLLRIFVAHHVTWCINSVCHALGTRPFDTRDASRNNLPLAILTFGEGWHNNHHASPASARHGMRWWQIDLVYWAIRLLETCGLAWDVRVREPNPRLARGANPNKVAQPERGFDPTSVQPLRSKEV